ncbi:MAG: MFS transporter [Gemmatimonadales bacterium]
MTTTVYRHRLVFAAAASGLLVFGVVLSALGPILPAVIARFGLDRTSAGALFSLLTFGVLLGSLVFGPAVDRYGYKLPLALATALMGLGLEAIALADELALFRAGVFAIGLGGGVVNGGTNALVADIHTGRRGAGLSLLGIFFGIGACGVPFALAVLQDATAYVATLAVIGALVALPLVLMAAIRFPEPKQPHGIPIRTALGLLKDPVLWLFGLVLFFESGMEITVGGWTAAYVGEELRLSAGTAAFFVSLYWLAMTVARLGLSVLLERRAPARVLLTSMAVAFAGAVALLAARAPAVAALGVVLAGAGFAGVFPIILGYVGERYPALSGTAFSLVLVLALCGGMTMPYVTGALADVHGLRASLLVVPVGIAMVVALFGLVQRWARAAEGAALYRRR